jgi:hypothetical protein
LALQTRRNARCPGRSRRDRASLEKLATVGPIHVVVAHLDRLLITEDWNASLPDLIHPEAMNENTEREIPRAVTAQISRPDTLTIPPSRGQWIDPGISPVGTRIAKPIRQKEHRPTLRRAGLLLVPADTGTGGTLSRSHQAETERAELWLDL